MKTLKGSAVSGGVAAGKTLVYREEGTEETPRYTVRDECVVCEWDRFTCAVSAAESEARERLAREEAACNSDLAGILKAHIMMLTDSVFHGEVKSRIERNRENAEWVVKETAAGLVKTLLSQTDPVLRERAVDIADMAGEVVDRLMGIKRTMLSHLDEDVILAARDLLPSQTLSLDRKHVKAIVLETGSRTSHTAILARSFGIPSIMGVQDVCKLVKTGDTVIVDGDTGEVTITPDEESLRRASFRAHVSVSGRAAAGSSLPAETTDGRRFALLANIERPEDAERALASGAEGIGLYRSEFLFLTPGQPAEEERQFQAYKSVAQTMKGLPVTIRTSDVGGDKILPGFYNLGEKNPLLGWRAIRFSLSETQLFKTQLRALLRASAFGNIRILVPLVSGIEEMEAVTKNIEEVKEELREKKTRFDENIAVGVMIEVPSAAICASFLAKKADFFSIGTNDLVQYALAVDRGNEKVSYLARPEHPAVLRLLKTTIDSAHAAGIKAAMCGEMAGQPLYTPLLAGLGLDEFSMSIPDIPLVKETIRGLSYEKCQLLAEKALSCESALSVSFCLNS